MFVRVGSNLLTLARLKADLDICFQFNLVHFMKSEKNREMDGHKDRKTHRQIEG